MKSRITSAEYIPVNPSRMLPVLQCLEENDGITASKIVAQLEKERLGKGGSLWAAIRSALNAKLVFRDGFFGYHLVGLGKAILRAPEDKALWRKAYLNATLYKNYNSYRMQQDPSYASRKDTNPADFVQWLVESDRATDVCLSNLMGRYFEVVHGITLRAALPVPDDLKQALFAHSSARPTAPPEAINKFQDLALLVGTYLNAHRATKTRANLVEFIEEHILTDSAFVEGMMFARSVMSPEHFKKKGGDLLLTLVERKQNESLSVDSETQRPAHTR